MCLFIYCLAVSALKITHLSAEYHGNCHDGYKDEIFMFWYVFYENMDNFQDVNILYKCLTDYL